jgi:hypothetical protein
VGRTFIMPDQRMREVRGGARAWLCVGGALRGAMRTCTHAC